MGIKNIEYEAEQGNAEALVKLGRIYLGGLGVDVDYKKAHNYFVRAAKEHNAQAYSFLAYTHAFGLGVDYDEEKVIELFEKASELNDDYASFALGFIYRKGLFGVDKDEEKSFEFAQKSSNGGFGPGKYEYAFLLEKKASKLLKSQDPQDVKKGEELTAQVMDLYKASADLNYAPAQYALAVRYINQNDAKKDKEAFDLLNKAKEANYSLAYYALAYMYDNARGCEQDFYKSFECYEKAYDLGYKKAVLDIANAYIFGLGVQQNYKDAIDLCREAVNGGIQEANYYAGLCFEYGLGVDEDLDKAIELYGYARTAGYEKAILKLGQIYDPYYDIGADEDGAREEYELLLDYGSLDGEAEILKLDLEEDKAKKIEELKGLAKQDSAVANEVLGTIYKDGNGVDQDTKQAIEYYKKAASLGSNKAVKELIGIAKLNSDKKLEVEYEDKLAILGTPKKYFERARALVDENEIERAAFFFAMAGLTTGKEENRQKAIDILKFKISKNQNGTWEYKE